MLPSPARRGIPAWIRWGALVWLSFWLAVYWRVYGPENFLHLCDIAVILACAGLWLESPLLLSSQAVGSVIVDAVWGLDVVWRLFLGRHLLGGTEYVFDPRYPLWVRLLTFFHVVTPPLLLWAVHRVGYDRRAWALQSVIAGGALVASRFTSPAENLNFAFRAPFFHRAWGPAPAHLAVSLLFTMAVMYLPVHLVLQRLFGPPKPTAP